MFKSIYCLKASAALRRYRCPIRLLRRQLLPRERKVAPSALTNELRFEESRIQIDPQSGTNTTIITIDSISTVAERTVSVDAGGIMTALTGRPQPPPAMQLAIEKSSLYFRIGSTNTLSFRIGAKILFYPRNT